MAETGNCYTVADLIAALQKFTPETLVRALAPSSMTTYPVYVGERGGAVELIGDEQDFSASD